MLEEGMSNKAMHVETTGQLVHHNLCILSEVLAHLQSSFRQGMPQWQASELEHAGSDCAVLQ